MTSNSNRIVSLWDMLEKLEAERLVQAIAYLSSTAKRFQSLHTALTARYPIYSQLNVEADANKPAYFSNILMNLSNSLGMLGVAQSAEYLTRLLQAFGGRGAPDDRTEIGNINQAINTVIESFGNELKVRKLFVMGPRYSHYYDAEDLIPGVGSEEEFYDAGEDMEAAGKCLAFGLPTACVFHLMRAAESVACVLVQSFGGRTHKENGEPETFGGLWKQVDNKIYDMPPGGERDALNKIKGFMSSLNRGDRTKVAHPGRQYSDQQAERLFGHTKSFLEEVRDFLYR